MLNVITVNCSDRQGVVTIQGDTMEEVQGADARRMALQAASSRISRPGVSTGAPYPVDADGNSSEDLMMGRAGAAAGYRVDYQVTGGL